MRLALAGILLLGVIIPNVFADDPITFGARVIPDKVIEGSEGIIQVYALQNGHVYFPAKINNLIVTSADSSIVKILGIHQDNSYLASIKFKALSAKSTTISLVDAGFTSYQFPISVYPNTHIPKQLLLKATPNKFSITKPVTGYISVELADDDGFPVRAIEDTIITLSTHDEKVLNLKSNTVVIHKGEYFAIEEFQVIGDGSATIDAGAQKIGTSSTTVTASNISSSPSVKLYVYPNMINSYAYSYGYAVAQLLDSSGNPTLAKENIPVALKITNSSYTETVNTSGDNPLITSNEPLIIPKGEYWGMTKIVVKAGLEGSYTASYSAKNYLVSTPPTFQVTTSGIIDNKIAKIDMLPILATGNKELVGIMHLEDGSGNSVIASQNMQIRVDTSDEQSLSVDNIKMEQGFGVVPVFAKTGTSAPSNLQVTVVTEPTQTVTPTITQLTTHTSGLMTEPAIQKILTNTDFPLAVYMTRDNGEMTSLSEDSSLETTMPDSSLQISQTQISTDRSIGLSNLKQSTSGDTKVAFSLGDYSSSSTISTVLPKETAIHMVYTDPALTNALNIFVLQLLDSQQQPVVLDRDVEIKLSPKDPTMLEIPDKVIIKKGEYYAIFSGKALKQGTTSISALSNDLPLTEFNVNVEDASPQVTISGPDNVKNGEPLSLSIHVQDQHLSPLQNMKINWQVTGATVQVMDSNTDLNGTGRISILAQSDDRIELTATVSGNGLETVEKTKIVGILHPVQTTGTGTPQTKILNIGSFDPMPVLIIGGIAGMVLFMNKKKLSKLTIK